MNSQLSATGVTRIRNRIGQQAAKVSATIRNESSQYPQLGILDDGCTMRDRYWLYVVYDCATPNPRLVCVQDPFGILLAKAKGSVLISAKEIMQVSI